jgi:hypothetical protein
MDICGHHPLGCRRFDPKFAMISHDGSPFLKAGRC